MSRVFVAGSINMDVVTKTMRHPSPGETVLGTEVRFVPGGKGANQTLASSRLGTETVLIGAVGTDTFGIELCSYLVQSGVNLSHVRRVEKTDTGTAIIVVNETGENTIVVVPGANGCLVESDVISARYAPNDILVAQFETPLLTTIAFFKYGKSLGTRTILNPSPARKIPKELLVHSDIIVLNASELQQLVDEQLSLESAAGCCRKLQAFKEQVVVLTLGKEGVVAVSGSSIIRERGLCVKAVDSTGAGDCFVGALASRLAVGMSLERSIAFANRAAALSVQRFGAGTSMPTLREVECFVPS